MSVLAGVHTIGGTENSSVSFRFESGIDGGVLRRIGLWAGPSGFGGIRLWLTNSDSPQTFGTTQGTYREFTFEDGERMSRLSLWGNGIGTRSGAIEFFTTRNRSFKHQMTSWRLQQEFPINVASGICVGARGRWGPEVIGLHALGMVFLNELAFAQMTNVRYPTLSFEAAGIQSVSIRDIHDTNDSHVADKNWTNTGSYSSTTSSSWSVTTGIQYHVGWSISAGIPGIVDVQGQVGWEISASATHENGSEETEEWTWERSGVIPPRHWHHFEITTRRGRINVPYEATMQVELRNGARFSYTFRGQYDGVSYARLDIVTRSGELGSDRSISSSTTPATAERPLIKENEKVHGSVKSTRVRAGSPFTPPPATGNKSLVPEALDQQSGAGQVIKGELGGEDVFIEEADPAASDGKADEPPSAQAI